MIERDFHIRLLLSSRIVSKFYFYTSDLIVFLYEELGKLWQFRFLMHRLPRLLRNSLRFSTNNLGSFTFVVRCTDHVTTYPLNTVKHVYKDYLGEDHEVVSRSKWSLFSGSLNQ